MWHPVSAYPLLQFAGTVDKLARQLKSLLGARVTISTVDVPVNLSGSSSVGGDGAPRYCVPGDKATQSIQSKPTWTATLPQERMRSGQTCELQTVASKRTKNVSSSSLAFTRALHASQLKFEHMTYLFALKDHRAPLAALRALLCVFAPLLLFEGEAWMSYFIVT